MDHDLPDREEIACALDTLEVRLARQGQYDGAADVGSAHRLLRAADDEIIRLRARVEELERENEELRADLIFAASNSVVYSQQVEKLFPNRGWVCEINAAPIFVEYDGTDTDLCRAIREARRGE